MEQALEDLDFKARQRSRTHMDRPERFEAGVGRFFSKALEVVDNIFSPHSTTQVGRVWQTLTSMPSRHPVPTAILVAGGAWVLWQRRKALNELADIETNTAKIEVLAPELPRMNSFADTAANVKNTSQHAVQSLQDAALQARDAYQEVTTCLAQSVQDFKASASQLKLDAQEGFQKAKEYVKEEPVNALTGGAALALGLFFLLKNAREAFDE